MNCPKGVACIIPVFNESNTIVGELKALSNIKDIEEIICVDDGSTDKIVQKLKSSKLLSRRIKLISLDQNRGKFMAVYSGLKRVKNEIVLLLDADLKNINTLQLKNAIKIFCNNPTLDMLILRHTNDHLINKIIRSDVVIIGGRLIRKRHLDKIFKTKANRFQLELAINNYMISNKLKYYWLPFSFQHFYKSQKYGFLKGWKKEFKMWHDLFSYKGVFYFIKNLATFCWSEYSIEKNKIPLQNSA